MRRKNRFIIGVLVAVLITGAGFGGAALAQGNAEDSQPDTLLIRVAGILEIDQQRIEEAFSQARAELYEENIDRHLQNLIEKGIITEEEAAAVKEGSLTLPDMEKCRERIKERFESEFDTDGFQKKLRDRLESIPDTEESNNRFQE